MWRRTSGSSTTMSMSILSRSQSSAPVLICSFWSGPSLDKVLKFLNTTRLYIFYLDAPHYTILVADAKMDVWL